MTDTVPAARRIGPLLATVLVAGNMIGSGVFLLPATLAVIGSSTIIGWIIASAGAMLLAGCFALLATLKPTPDGFVEYPAQGLHPFFGFANWFLYWLSCWVGSPAIALAVTGYLTFFFQVLSDPVIAVWTTIGVIWLMTLANVIGARTVARLGGLTLVIGLAPIAVATVLGLLAFDPAVFAAGWNVTGKPLTQAVGGSLAPIFWAFLGLESATVAAAVVRDPERNVARAALGGVGLAAVVYMAASVALMGAIPVAVLAKSPAPFADAIQILAGSTVASVIAVCALLKAAGTMGGWLLLIAEAARSGAAAGFMPRVLSSRDPARTPVRDLLLAAGMMSVVIASSMSPTLGKQFGVLINIAVNLSMVAYALCALALIRFAGGIADRGKRLAARVMAVGGAAFAVWVVAASDATMLAPSLWAFAATVPLYGLVLLARRVSGTGKAVPRDS
ncbi:MAG: amino acid permease [Caulobacterales bacterium]|nr:amino acid permease [Caulobacterales bacterium]